MRSMLHDAWLDIPNVVILHSFCFEPVMVSVSVYKTGGLDKALKKSAWSLHALALVGHPARPVIALRCCVHIAAMHGCPTALVLPSRPLALCRHMVMAEACYTLLPLSLLPALASTAMSP
jgi:hypothetical protein